MIYERSQPTIKRQGEWRRHVCTLRVYEEKYDDEINCIDKVMVGQVES
jgi:hypothetical protein